MDYHQGPPIGRDGKKRRKWIARTPLEPAKVYDPMAVFAIEAGCHEAIAKINRAAAAGDQSGIAAWRRKLEERCPGLRALLRKSGHTLEPAHREKLTIMDRELTKLLRPLKRKRPRQIGRAHV